MRDLDTIVERVLVAKGEDISIALMHEMLRDVGLKPNFDPTKEDLYLEYRAKLRYGLTRTRLTLLLCHQDGSERQLYTVP